MKRTFYFLTWLFLFASCQDANLDTVEDSLLNTTAKTIPISTALESLEELICETGIKTKASMQNISTGEILVIGGQDFLISTRSENDLYLPDTLLYALNFIDGGFAILSANTNLNDPVICITDAGKVSLDRFSKGFSLLQSTDCEYCVDSKSETKGDIDDIICEDTGIDYLYSLVISSVLIDYNDNQTTYERVPETKESSSASVGPLLTTKWTQSFPFNKYKDPPGCAVIAAGQIMAYNKKPALFKFHTVSSYCTWDTLKTVYPSLNYTSQGTPFASDQVAVFAAELANSSNCDVDSSGGTTINKVKDTFTKFGYSVTKRLGCENGDIAKICQQLSEKKPIYMRGQRKDSTTGRQVGHAWVIDGATSSHFHINWGWQGDADGYYAKGVFSTASLEYYSPSDTGTNTYQGSSTRNYYHYFRFLLY